MQKGNLDCGASRDGVGSDLDHEMSLSQAVKCLTQGGMKGPYVRHDVGTQGEGLSPSQVARGHRKTG